MSKFKNLFIAVLVTLCLTSGLAAPVSALDVSTEISHFYFSINGSTFKSSGNYISGAMISGNPTDTGNTTVTSYAILVPFTAPCQSLTLTVGMWTGILNSVGSYTADWGVIKGGKYTASGSVPVEYFSGSQEVYSYALDSSSTNSYRINRYYTFDLSGVDATGGANCFVRLSYSNADFPLRTHLKALNGLVYHGTATFKSTTAQLPTYTSSTTGNTFVAKATKRIWIDGDEREIMWGASSSSTRLRIYDKALERGVDGHWIRAEFQFRDEAADSFIANYLSFGDIGLTYGGVLLNYLRYTTKAPNPEKSHNYDALNTAKWWDKFVGTSQKIHNVTVGGLPYNLQSLEDFISTQCASSIRAFIEVSSVDRLLDIVKHTPYSSKQKQLLNSLGVVVDA